MLGIIGGVHGLILVSYGNNVCLLNAANGLITVIVGALMIEAVKHERPGWLTPAMVYLVGDLMLRARCSVLEQFAPTFSSRWQPLLTLLLQCTHLVLLSLGGLVLAILVMPVTARGAGGSYVAATVYLDSQITIIACRGKCCHCRKHHVFILPFSEHLAL